MSGKDKGKKKRKKSVRKTKKSKELKETNVVELFTGRPILVPLETKLNSEKLVKNILKQGGLKDKGFLLITWDEPTGGNTTYYTSGDTRANILWELKAFENVLLGLQE